MKQFAASVCMLLMVCAVMAQTTTTKTAVTSNPQIYIWPERMPEFPGGQGALTEFLTTNTHTPTGEAVVQGKVIVQFIISEEGNLEDVKVVKGISPAFDNEALRVIALLPKFKPGMQSGKPVKVYYNLAVNFV